MTVTYMIYNYIHTHIYIHIYIYLYVYTYSRIVADAFCPIKTHQRYCISET